ncbi:4-oxalomesaconate tautomerase [Luteibacter sp. Sphag1AF]|uniref:4-oxalomesaconate tautomerase n=1 Tax=Luteibacter sp. Sphag1AF TaxID=2587031 RepID=UPI0016192871|nr:4-oxalomesaconate tautomerase [Luteibacter sp. Sphag1AF]MBB3226810.1 4-oxalomesaconate tautomerase [Luteibacter sp. Sphag1AF]
MAYEIPCWYMRGGTSKGPFFLARDLPSDTALRDAVILAAMGSPDARQIDGLGGAHPLTSKIGILSLPTDGVADLDFLFAQVGIAEGTVDTTPNCGNMLAAALPAALEAGLLRGDEGTTTRRVRTLNTGVIAEIAVLTPGGTPTYDGVANIDGVPHPGSPISCGFLDTAGSLTGSLLPTGNTRDVIDGVPVTLIDNGMPVMLIAAADVGVTGYESREELDANTPLKARIELLRLAAGPLMNLGDVSRKPVPKVTLVAAPRAGGALCTRTFIPHDCHAAIGVLGAVTVATAAVMKGSVAHDVAKLVDDVDHVRTLSIEHPTGEFSVELALDGDRVVRAALLRTARLLMRGGVPVSPSLWRGPRA